MSFLDNIISKNNSGDDFVKYKDIVLNLDVCLLMLKNGDIEYINPAGEALISRINGCSKEDYDCEICEKQINLLLEQGNVHAGSGFKRLALRLLDVDRG